jgi:hypothetical protein
MAKHGPCQKPGMNLNVWERKTAPVSYYITAVLLIVKSDKNSYIGNRWKHNMHVRKVEYIYF